jgi:hypothetical protein
VVGLAAPRSTGPPYFGPGCVPRVCSHTPKNPDSTDGIGPLSAPGIARTSFPATPGLSHIKAVALPRGGLTNELRRDYIRPAIEAVSLLLEEAEAFGDAVLDMHLAHGREISLMDSQGRYNQTLPRYVHCGSAILTVPTEEDERAELAKRWEREVARDTGITLWEKAPKT